MLNSNFDLRTFLTESKNPTLSEGAKFKVGDMVKLSGGEPTEVLAVRKMTDSDLHAYSIKNSKGERAEYDETQLTAADVSEVLSEATVMEYIRERMDRMNDEVRSCMREYIQACNEIDPGHEDAHAQLMNALEDFYNKLKAHFEEDEAEMEEPLATSTDSPQIPVEEGPVYPEDKHLMTPDEFGGEEDELDEASEETKLTYDDFVQMTATYLRAFSAPDEYASDEMIKSRAKSLYNSYLQGEDPEDMFSLEEGAYGAPSGDAELDKERLEALKAELKALEDKGAPAGIIAVKKKEIARFNSVEEAAINEDAGIYQGLVDTAMSMGSEKDTALFLAGLVKTVVHLGAVPALVAALYPFKDKPVVQKLLAKLEKFADAD